MSERTSLRPKEHEAFHGTGQGDTRCGEPGGLDGGERSVPEAEERPVNVAAAYAGGIDGERLGDALDVPLDRLAHEIRTPLAAIQAMADALSGGHLGAMENPRHALYVASMAETARHALAVVEAMLANHGTRGSVADASCSIAVGALAHEVVLGMSLLAARSGVRLDNGSGGDEITAKVRATDLRQMLINLVANGIGHAGGGATVTVGVGRDNGEAWVEVADDGPGIPVAVLERFAAGTPLDGASATDVSMRVRLGLSLTRALAEANAGRLDIVTGQSGTRVRIVLPAG